jgi:hypothetical protein
MATPTDAPHAGDRVIAFIDFVKSLRWPGVLVLALLLLLDPLKATLGTFSPEAEAAPTGVVMLGDLPLHVRPQTMPRPSEFIVRAVQAMDADLLRSFLDMDQNAIYCGSLTAEYRAGMRRLADLGLVEARSDASRTDQCRDYAVMTELGKQVETYLISLNVSLLKG